MNREELIERVEDLAAQLQELGGDCTMHHFGEDTETYRALFYLIGEFCRHSGFQLDSFLIYLKTNE